MTQADMHSRNISSKIVEITTRTSNSTHDQLPFFTSLYSSQQIPACRMRSTIAIAVRNRFNSSFCRALKSSPGLTGLRTMLDGISNPPAVPSTLIDAP
jgi:hypothetical protein